MSSGYPSGLTASAFELLIRMYWSPTAYDDWAGDSGKINARSELVFNDLLENRRLSERGNAMARYILNTPLPIQRWEVPSWPAPL